MSREQSGNVESVQFMQFESEGNLYVYEPGAGCSGIPRKIEQGFTQDELNLTSTPSDDVCSSQFVERFPKLKSENIHKFVPKSGLVTIETHRTNRR